jgi:hypothetical protein
MDPVAVGTVAGTIVAVVDTAAFAAGIADSAVDTAAFAAGIADSAVDTGAADIDSAPRWERLRIPQVK